MTNIPIYAGLLPPGFCPSGSNGWQDVLDTFASVMTVNLSSSIGASVIVQAAKPADTSVIWVQIDALGRPLREYAYGQGAWLSQHPIAPGMTMWWFAPLPDFTSFDGGDSNIAGPQSGPMWQQALDSNSNVIAAKFPITAGTLPSGMILSLGMTGGEELHILTAAEAGVDPRHRHTFGRYSTDWHQGAFETGGTLTPGTPGEAVGGSGDVTPQSLPDITTFGDATHHVQTDAPLNALTTVGHNTLPPYVVGYLLQRTSRQFYAVT